MPATQDSSSQSYAFVMYAPSRVRVLVAGS